ncbi:MAG: hypothetical protein IPP45_07830 [Sphingomonadales bacterium]|nr:hypothetical protein [Sphingomonadales bacterium]
MNEAETRAFESIDPRINPERIAYWYFRLNGFMQIENFVVHPKLYGGQRTDADLIGVRFPFRAERFIDDPTNVMEDDVDRLRLSSERIDIVITEIKTGRCALNGPWTNEEQQNIHRVLAAIGGFPTHVIESAASALYADAIYDDPDYPRVRLVLLGREADTELAAKYAGITQVTWNDVLSFIWQRFDRYRRQKAQVDQWDGAGRLLKGLARRENEADFIAKACKMMGVSGNAVGAPE